MFLGLRHFSSIVHNLKLLWTILIQERNGNSNIAVVIRRDSIYIRHINRIIIIIAQIAFLPYIFMLTITKIVFHRHKTKRFMTASMVKIC